LDPILLIFRILFNLSLKRINKANENIVSNAEIPIQIKKIITFWVPMSIIIGNTTVIAISGISKLRIIVKNINFFSFALEIGNVSNHSKIDPDRIFIVFNIAIRKKLKN